MSGAPTLWATAADIGTPHALPEILDVEHALETDVAARLIAALRQGRRVHVTLLLPPPVWSTDAALQACRQRRLERAVSDRIRELSQLAGSSVPFTVSIERRRRRWWHGRVRNRVR
jgi:hypothetical protein